MTDKDKSIMDTAWKLYKNKSFNECIYRLEFEYPDLGKDAVACNLLSLCYAALNKYQEAIHFIDKAISLDTSTTLYLFNKGIYLFNCYLIVDGLKCFKEALKLTENEKNLQTISIKLVNLVTVELQYLSPRFIHNNTDLKKYIEFFDLIIHLKDKFQMFSEIKKTAKDQKERTINYLYTYAYSSFNGKNIEETLSKCNALLQVNGLSQEQKDKIHALINLCNNVNKNGKEVFLKKIPKNPIPSSHTNSNTKRDAIENMLELGLSKIEMIEQLSTDFSISEESALAIINAYFDDD